jgi:hypothetical protein
MSNHISFLAEQIDATLKDVFIPYNGAIIERVSKNKYLVFGKEFESEDEAKNKVDEARSNRSWLAKSIKS